MDEESIPERRYAKIRHDAEQRLSEAQQAHENNETFDERYAQAVAATEEFVAFRAELPALLLEPRPLASRNTPRSPGHEALPARLARHHELLRPRREITAAMIEPVLS